MLSWGLQARIHGTHPRPSYLPPYCLLETGFHFWTHLGRITRVTDSIAPRQAVNPAATFTLNAAKSRDRAEACYRCPSL